MQLHQKTSNNIYTYIMQLGDPTAYGNIPPCPAIISAVTAALQSPGSTAGYVNACGTPEARTAIAKHHSNLMKDDDRSKDGEEEHEVEEQPKKVDVTPDDVIVANGASGALELALTALLDEDSVLLGESYPIYMSYYISLYSTFSNLQSFHLISAKARLSVVSGNRRKPRVDRGALRFATRQWMGV